MKILLTGVTGRQAKESKISKQKIYDTQLIYKILIELGHEVTWKQTRINENFDKYDLGIIALGPGASFNSGNLVNALWIIDKLPTILHFEDWKITSLLRSYQGCIDNPEKTILKKIKNGYFYNNAGDYKLVLKQLISNFEKILNLNQYNYKCIVPGFKWGNKSIIKQCLKTNNIVSFDLTPLVITKEFFKNKNVVLWDEEEKKRRSYFLASLNDHKSWVKKMKLTWSVITTEKGREFKTELDVFKQCKNYWGILAPEYDHSGSGWFRIRFIYSALSNSCIICSNKDAEQLGKYFYFNKEEFENFSDLELKEHSSHQKEVIESYMTSYDELKETFIDILKI